jgi:hypothetical protein
MSNAARKQSPAMKLTDLTPQERAAILILTPQERKEALLRAAIDKAAQLVEDREEAVA